MVVLDFLKRCAFAVFAFGLSFAILYYEIGTCFILISLINHIEANGGSMQEEAGNSWKVIQRIDGEGADSISSLALFAASIGAVIFAVSCLSDRISDALVRWRQWITAFICFGSAVILLFLPILYATSWIISSTIGFTMGSNTDSTDPHLQQLGRQQTPETVKAFFTDHVMGILLGVAIATGLLSWYITVKLAFSDKLPWCQLSAIPRRPSPSVAWNRARDMKTPPAKTVVSKAPATTTTKPTVPTRSTQSVLPTATTRNPAKDKLFGNLPMDQWPSPDTDSANFPWSEFVVARNYLDAGQTAEAIACWQTIIATPNIEALHYAQAWHFLRQNGVLPAEGDAKTIYGVVGEQGASGVLTAIFSDGQARVYSDNGQAIVWEHPDASLDSLIESILYAATVLVRKIKQNDPQLSLSKSSINTISFLTPSGIYIKTGAPNVLEATPLIKPIADGLAEILTALMQKVRTAK